MLDLARSGEGLLLGAFRESDVDLRAPSRLPGWTRAHVIAHLIGNAGALGNLLTWARTGVETPMYASRAARAEQITRDVERAGEWLVASLRESSTALTAAMADLSPSQWTHPVRSAMGRSITAAEVPWLRSRESFVHLVDLDVGVEFPDLPPDFLAVLLDDVTRAIGAKQGCPSVRLGCGSRSWTLGAAEDSGNVVDVVGSLGDLAAWVTGRTHPADRPPLPAWL